MVGLPRCSDAWLILAEEEGVVQHAEHAAREANRAALDPTRQEVSP